MRCLPMEIRIKIPKPNEVLPEDFRKHMLQAYKELLLAIRSLIDVQIKKLEKSEKKEIKKIDIS
ncbi:MAG TPA: hypothetical protein EYG81_01505 [Archaeoglobus profundus]|nr:hypothetical protein [Archaeoglobus profundus]HIP58529.1 hypothetical protein [Archaeoglobus profundus]